MQPTCSRAGDTHRVPLLRARGTGRMQSGHLELLWRLDDFHELALGRAALHNEKGRKARHFNTPSIRATAISKRDMALPSRSFARLHFIKAGIKALKKIRFDA